jgi:hypothetical protein
MTSPAPFVDVCGFPADGEPVEPTPRAAHHLIAAGWTPPTSDPVKQCGHRSIRNITCQRNPGHDGFHGRAGMFWDDQGWAS